MKTFFLLSVSLAAALTAQTAPAVGSLDSVVLERTACFGWCPIYRLSLTGAGVVQFHSRPRQRVRGDTARTARDSIEPAAVAALLPAAVRLGIFDLPPVIAQARELCPSAATDLPTAIVTVYTSQRVQKIVDYHGCFVRIDRDVPSRLDKLREFERMIDSTAGSKRWVNSSRKP